MTARPAHRRPASPAMIDRQDRRFFAPLFGILLVVVLPIVALIAGADAAHGASPGTKAVSVSPAQSVTVLDVPADVLDRATPIPSPSPVETAPAWSGVLLPACEHDDGFHESGACYWDARAQGNGQGRSFVAVGSTFYYLP